jgi:cytochrome b6-f complex iron-sulfur subunit
MAKETPPPQAEKKSISRREAMNFAWLASLGFLSVSLAGVGFLFAMPRFKEGEFGGVVTVGTASELPEVGAAPANYPKVKFWLTNTDEGVYAIYKVCTHLGCLYNWVDQENKFICPCHGSQFQSSGQYIQGPAPRSLDRFVVQAIDPATGNILAETPPDGGAMPLPGQPEAVIQVNTGERINGQPHA